MNNKQSFHVKKDFFFFLENVFSRKTNIREMQLQTISYIFQQQQNFSILTIFSE